MGARGLDVAHNVVDISEVRAGGDIGALYDHLEHDHGWKQTDVITGSELLMLHFQTHHEAVVTGSHMLGRHDGTPKLDGHRLAESLRTAAEHPAPTPASPLWVEGFCDGLRFSASILDLAADDRLNLENFGEMIAKMTTKGS